MKIIKLVCGKIDEEQYDACSYAKLAIEYRDSHRRLAEVFYSLSQEEVKHATMLHNEVVRLIEDYRSKNGEPPVAMMAVYEYLHGKSIEKAEEIKRYQSMFLE